jgi:hypothetical protein
MAMYGASVSMKSIAHSRIAWLFGLGNGPIVIDVNRKARRIKHDCVRNCVGTMCAMKEIRRQPSIVSANRLIFGLPVMQLQFKVDAAFLLPAKGRANADVTSRVFAWACQSAC